MKNTIIKPADIKKFDRPTNTKKRWAMNTWGIFIALLGAVFMLGASPGMALDPDPTFQIAAKNIQRVPTSFKFQAAISQAKMPVGEAVFQTLIVNLKKGDQEMCSETFNDVQVRDSVLNMEIGKQMSCDMDAVMAEHSGLTVHSYVALRFRLYKVEFSSVQFRSLGAGA